ncbi:MAG: hypothetical protein CVU54_15745 [Deltaproteobacteria bacterium HGW-Deltaproteobacteria-12]|nr:MAG: hypothetical protein CVU54_15745 [Deltaproteobacteria bacterium HGW-Deltaproteobacteria-12]
MIHLLDRYLSTLFFAPLARRRHHEGGAVIPILMYHSISSEPETETHPYFWLNTTPEIFAAQLKFLQDNNYQVLTLGRAAEIIYGRAVKDDHAKYAVITFDDGFRDFYINAFPILQKYGFTATVFLPTDYINNHHKKLDGKDHLSWGEITLLHKQGISFGSHTASHPQLRDSNRADVRHEIEHSRQIIEQRIGAPAESFSYPFAFPEEDNDFTKCLTDTLIAGGYKFGVSTRIGRASAKDPICFMKRLPINSRDDLAFFQAKLEGGYDWMHWFQLKSKIIRAKFKSS